MCKTEKILFLNIMDNIYIRNISKLRLLRKDTFGSGLKV